MDPRPLSEGNRLQRAYARWAEPYYRKMTPEQRVEAERIDRWLYSRTGWPAWLGMLSVTAGVALLLVIFGHLPVAMALGLGVAITLSLGFLWMEPWFFPERFAGGRPLARKALVGMGMGLIGAVVGFTVAEISTLDGSWPDPARLRKILQGLLLAMLAAALVMAPLTAFQWAMARLRRRRLEREVTELRLAQERDASAREAAEARLRLLQAQVHPHFVFNTLAAVQHWVDQGDARAAPLLRALTAFLRGSTEMLGRERTTLGEEAAMVGHYLAIMQARLGQRLRSHVEVPSGLAATELPPGLLLTLVENALEHGIEPALAGGTVTVLAELDESGSTVRVRVRDDGLGLPASWQEGVGLSNSRQRLVHHFGSSARLDVHAREPGTEAVMSWPTQGAGT
jgi:two-component sensor histidine kinase